MNQGVEIRAAVAAEAACSSQLAIASKAHWGYSPELMEACVDELTVSGRLIDSKDHHYVVAVVEGDIVGFYALEDSSGDEIEPGALFVSPLHIGTGIGRSLIENAKKHAFKLGANIVNVQGDPNAIAFYRAAGGVMTGNKESESIAGRFLPTFQIDLSADTVA